MRKKTSNFLNKIVKKDYNNLLEEILEKKDFEENVKNLLLEILYKTEVAYKDYKTVKRDVESQDEYMKKITRIIQKNCKKITTVKPKSEQAKILKGKSYEIDKENKTITCYPIGTKMLYCIAQISKQDKIINEKYYLVNKTLAELINIGNSIDKVEPLRDFNGWSWSTIKKEIENIDCNLAYQNLRILLGNEFLEKWVNNKEYILDYYDLLQLKLEEKYGTENKDNFMELLNLISVLVYKEIYSEEKEKLEKEEEEKKALLQKFEKKQEYIEQITKEKLEITNQIKYLEKIKASRKSLQEEYQKRNENLPLEKKIFSMKVLAKQLKEEEQELKQELEKRNRMLNPTNYVEEKNKLEKQYNLLKTENLTEKLIEFQNIFMECFEINLKIATEKEDIINLIYNFRYYEMLPIDEKRNIQEVTKLQERLKIIEKKLWKKALNTKLINENISFEIFQYIFKTKIISLETLYITIKKVNNKIIIEFTEDNENGFEEKFEISNKEEIDENNIFRGNKNGHRFKLFS
ncbi:MAG: hypothetical protein IJV31_05440 [Clostridia bacterium]|nr:hypothetical protein [Clostridia bacterium]